MGKEMIKHRIGKSQNGEVHVNRCTPQSADDRKVIGIEGKWYNITDFIDKHPGGPIIKHFIGQDASTVFRAYGHSPLILKHRKVVGTYQQKDKHPCDKDFSELHRKLESKGFFRTDWVFYTQKVLMCMALLAACFTCVVCFPQWYMHYLGAVFLELFWRQCVFIMHDFMHHQVFRNANKDQAGGVVMGTLCLGFSAHWWQDEHFLHHALTNTVNVAKKFTDPQMWGPVWAQNEKLFPLYNNVLQSFLISIQHFTFIPLVTLSGRIPALLDSYIAERRWYEWVAIIGHWIWMSYLLSFLPTWREILIFYFFASSLQGILYIQLLLSHYCRMCVNEDELHQSSWNRLQVLSILNIECPVWMDWYWGGLNFHIEHHLYPKMARNRLSEASTYIKEICKKHDIEYASTGFFSAIAMTLRHLKKTGTHFSMDPR